MEPSGQKSKTVKFNFLILIHKAAVNHKNILSVWRKLETIILSRGLEEIEADPATPQAQAMLSLTLGNGLYLFNW